MKEIVAVSAGMIVTVSGYSGTFDKAGKFTATQTGSGTTAQAGSIGLSYTLEGKFTSKGWEGDFSYAIVFAELGLTCNYTTTFSGEKQ